MSKLSEVIVDAKYLDLIGLAAFLLGDDGIQTAGDSDEIATTQEKLAALIFRWAAGQSGDELE